MYGIELVLVSKCTFSCLVPFLGTHVLSFFHIVCQHGNEFYVVRLTYDDELNCGHTMYMHVSWMR